MWKRLLFPGIFLLLTVCKSPSPRLEGGPVPLLIAEPQLAITSITILQADLINTSFKLSLKIDNPNPFPITISSFRYELYGDGALWADGMEKTLTVVPAKTSSETNFVFNMNFINMRRGLLDDIIAMRDVRYRIAGSAEVKADAPGISGFRMNFDYSGNSAVLR